MSLKSFDKFCEKMILGDPESNKEYQDMLFGKKGAGKDIYDERQNQVRSKLFTEALIVYAALSFFAVAIYEGIYQFCESIIPVLAVCMALCYLFWVIRNLACGTLLGVKYKIARNTAWIILLECVWFGYVYFSDYFEAEEQHNFFANNGMLTDEFCMLTAMLMMVITSVITLIAVSAKKKEDAQEQCDNE
ncbi:MAG: hypothetical protein IJZ95_05215 [Oscillospiraceae bacterium]|nr:hypothetical protein [Oscillospiraceae bacterium]